MIVPLERRHDQKLKYRIVSTIGESSGFWKANFHMKYAQSIKTAILFSAFLILGLAFTPAHAAEQVVTLTTDNDVAGFEIIALRGVASTGRNSVFASRAQPKTGENI